MPVRRHRHPLAGQAQASTISRTSSGVNAACSDASNRSRAAVRLGPGVELDEPSHLGPVGGPGQVADQERPARRDQPGHLGQRRRRVGDVVDDRVGDDRLETARRGRQALGIAPRQADPLGEARLVDVARGQSEHRPGQVDAEHPGLAVGPAEGDRDAGRAGPDVEDLAPPARAVRLEEVGDEPGVDRRVVHRVVVARLLGRVHRLGFEHAGQHRGDP